jgi:hypothetical protein
MDYPRLPRGVRKLTISWISAVHPLRQLLRSFLRMRNFLNAIRELPLAEDARRARLEARTAAMQPISIPPLPPGLSAYGLSFLREEDGNGTSRYRQVHL